MPDRFKKVVARIMRSSKRRVPVAESPPDRPGSFGWLRKPEHDEPGGEAWELPDGEIRLIARSQPLAVARERGQPRAGRKDD